MPLGRLATFALGQSAANPSLLRRWAIRVGLLAAALVAGGSLGGAELPSPLAVSLNMSQRVDELLAEGWTQHGVEPAAAADDGELLRRLCLDLTGVIPEVSQTRAYLADARPEKRGELIDRLLLSPAHATHLADVWRDLMLPRKFDPQQIAGLIGVQNWLRRQFVDNRRYDRIVADLLVATGGDESGPALFYTALGVKPEELGTTTARIFLGVRLDCAQCHNHPFDRWTQQDFWGYAAFFARLQQRSAGAANMRLVDVESGEVHLPDSDAIVPARYPGGAVVDPRERGTRRQQLAIWMASRDNPYLARATVNLVWAQLFGRGLVEPLDDFGEHNPASHPKLLEELADAFVTTNYDLRWLFRMLTNTQAYQLSSRPAGAPDPPAELFARMAVKTLTPEQLYDSLGRVALRTPAESQDRLADPRRQAFLMKMQAQTRSVTDFELGVPQALTLMNGPELNQATDAAQSALLTALEAPFLNEGQRVEAAFLGTLARLPRNNERTQFVEYVESKPSDQRKAALGDVVWALLNSAEFALNH
jgi:uncharacterized protein DUF1549/uncharacterized protein DUF1553